MQHALEPLEADQIVLGIAEVLRALGASAGGRAQQATCRTAIERARHYLNAHFTRLVTPEELERICDLDRYALARHYRQQLGTAPYRYLTMRRPEKTQSALLAGQTFADVAGHSRTTRQFKGAYGLPPGRWQAIQIPNLLMTG